MKIEQFTRQNEKHDEEYYKNLLLDMEKEEMAKFKKPESDNTESSSDDVAERLETFNEATAEGELSGSRLLEIKKALKRIEIGMGNLCAICGKEIETRRRDADPASITCIEHRNEEDKIRLEDL